VWLTAALFGSAAVADCVVVSGTIRQHRPGKRFLARQLPDLVEYRSEIRLMTAGRIPTTRCRGRSR
jgi:hypothetical protein